MNNETRDLIRQTCNELATFLTSCDETTITQTPTSGLQLHVDPTTKFYPVGQFILNQVQKKLDAGSLASAPIAPVYHWKKPRTDSLNQLTGRN